MNSLGLIYKEIPMQVDGEIIEVPSISDIYNTTRNKIKPQFKHWKLKANNKNGAGARQFNRKLGRFKSDWLDFEILNFDASADFYPSEEQIDELKLAQDTVLADGADWRACIKEEVAEAKVYLLVGMTALLEQDQFRMSMLDSGIPSDLWPCKFEMFEFIVTNAPICQFIRYRPHVLI